MDYVVNVSLAIFNIVFKKYDWAGLIIFLDKIGVMVKADSKVMQFNKIFNVLYVEQEWQVEANYELLYYVVCKLIVGWSMILLYINFESWFVLEWVLLFLCCINCIYLFVVIFFENIEICIFIEEEAIYIEDIYLQIVVWKYLNEKVQMVQ